MIHHKPTTSKEFDVHLDDSLLTDAFDNQLKLVEKSLPVKKTKDMTNKPQVHKAKVNVFSNRSRKYRFGDEEERIETPSMLSINEYECQKNQIMNDKEKIMPPPVDAESLPQIEDEDQAHASMLMSWYMAGYHTGYYKAMKKFKK